MEHLEGKVAVVTGAASGIGRAMATQFAAAGMKVVLADIEKFALDDAVAGLRATGAEAVGVHTDVSVGSEVEALRDAALDSFGAVHVVCNNAGVGAGGLSWEQTPEDWEWVLGVNLWGVIHGVRTFVPLLLEQGEGHVVNTASMAGHMAGPFMGIYNVSKFGVVALSETMYAELAMTNPAVGVSVLCPGWVNTRIHESHRNRPATEVDAPPDEGSTAMFRDVLGGLLQAGLQPTDVADMVVDAVRTNRFYILTHPHWNQFITNRAEAIVEGRNPIPVMLPDS